MRCLRDGIDEENDCRWLNDFDFVRGLPFALLAFWGADGDKLVGEVAKDKLDALEEAEAWVPCPHGNFMFAYLNYMEMVSNFCSERARLSRYRG